MLIGDSAFPLNSYPTEFNGQPIEGWCVYIPGGDAYHGWTEADVAHLKAQPWCRYLLPIFVRSDPTGAAEAVTDAKVAIAWAKTNGQPAHTLTQLDYETAVEAPYEEQFAATLEAGDGDLELLYGSKATVTKNPKPDGGYQIASWTNSDTGLTQPTQFYGGPDYDLSWFPANSALWDLRPTATTPAAPAPQEDDDVTTYYPIQVGPDPTGAPNACGVATWPAGAAHVMQLIADPGVWQDTTGTFRLVFNLTTGPDVETTHVAGPGDNVEIEFASVPGLNKAICRGVTITRPDGKRWPWGGGAA